MILDAKILFLNKHNTKNNQFRLHTHNCYELVYFIAGDGKAIVGGKSYQVSAHSYCIIPPHTEHIEALEGYGEILFIGFEYGSLRLPLKEGCYCNGEVTKLSFFNAIFDEYKQQRIGYKDAAGYFLKLFLISVLRNAQADDKKCKDLTYIKTYIEQHADQKINFHELSVLSGYSYDYFRHIFKQKFGVSPQEYMIDIRLNNAKRLLKDTTLSCTEIAYCCGFSNSPQMTTMFKAKFKITPTTFRNNRLV